jgi:hypothetical protein
MKNEMTLITIVIILLVGIGSVVIIADAGRTRGGNSLSNHGGVTVGVGGQSRLTASDYILNNNVLSDRLSSLLNSGYYQNNSDKFGLFNLTPSQRDTTNYPFAGYLPNTIYIPPTPYIPGTNNEYGGCLYTNGGWVCP